MGLVGLAQIGSNVAPLGLWNLVSAGAYAAIGIGIIRGSYRAFTWAIATNSLNIVFGISQVLAQGNAIMGLLLIIEVLIIVLLAQNRHLFGRPTANATATSSNSGIAERTPWQRFLHGGLLEVMNGRTIANSLDAGSSYATPPVAPPRRRSALGLTILGIIVVFVAGVSILAWATRQGPIASNERPTTPISNNTGETKPQVPTYVVDLFMTNWRVLEGAAADQLDERAIPAVRKCVQDMRVNSFDGKIKYIGESTITVYETGTQHECYGFEVSPVVRMTSTLFMPITFRVSVAKDTKKVIAVVPRAM